MLLRSILRYDPIPVSYTHLDVYKRQVLDKFLKTMQTTATRLQEKLLRPEIRQKGKEQVKDCLLYTSRCV